MTENTVGVILTTSPSTASTFTVTPQANPTGVPPNYESPSADGLYYRSWEALGTQEVYGAWDWQFTYR